MAEWVTNVEAKKILGLTDKALRYKRERGLLPAKKVKGKWLLDISSLTGNGGGAAESSVTPVEAGVSSDGMTAFAAASLKLKTEQARLAAERADKQALDNAVQRGLLIPAEYLETITGELVSLFRSKLINLAPQLAPICVGIDDPSELQEIMKKPINDILNEIAQAGE